MGEGVGSTLRFFVLEVCTRGMHSPSRTTTEGGGGGSRAGDIHGGGRHIVSRGEGGYRRFVIRGTLYRGCRAFERPWYRAIRSLSHIKTRIRLEPEWVRSSF